MNQKSLDKGKGIKEYTNGLGMSIRDKILKYGNSLEKRPIKYGELECLICHGFYNNLGAHVYMAHQITGKVYLHKFNLPNGSLMASKLKKQLQKRMITQSHEMVKKSIPKVKEFWADKTKSKHARELMSKNMIKRYANGYVSNIGELNRGKIAFNNKIKL